MRRFLTLGLVVGLSMLAAAGLVDALRGQPERQRVETSAPSSQASPSVQVGLSTATPPPWVEDRAALGDRLRRNGVTGTLYLSAAGCADGRARPLRALRLPELELRDGPRTKGCRLTVPDGERAGHGGTGTADPRDEFVTSSGTGYLEVSDREGRRVWISPIETAAFDWSPDGDWLAYAGHDRNVYFVRTSDWTTRFSLQASTRGLVWH